MTVAARLLQKPYGERFTRRRSQRSPDREKSIHTRRSVAL